MKNFIKKIAVLLPVTMFAVIMLCQPVYANEIAENAANWVLDGLFWLVLVLVLSNTAFQAVKRNLSGALITLVVGAIVLILIKNPTIIESLGNTLKGILGL